MELLSLWIGLAIFVLGTVVGSFLNVCIYRLPLGLSVVGGRSCCPHCRAIIRWYDNIPLFSYLLLRGRCRRCGGAISPRYPGIELANGLLWLIACHRYGISGRGALCALALSVLLTVACIDGATGLIPDQLWVALLALAAGSLWLPGFPTLTGRVAGALCISLPMLAAACLWGGFGGGDIKLCAAFGALAGWQAMVLATLIASLAGSAWGLWLVAARGANGKTAFSFGPFLALGMGISLLWGPLILAWYQGLFFF